MEVDGVFEPPTPAKPVPARCGHNSQAASTSGRGTEKENIYDEFLCPDALGTKDYLKGNGNKGSSVLDVAGNDPKNTPTVQNDTSCQHCMDSVPDSRKRRNNGNDLNKKRSQRPRVKKHRPKIYDDSNPKKVPKVNKTPKPVTPNPIQERRAHSITAHIPCKRALDLNLPAEIESHHPTFNFESGRIVTSKRNTIRRSRFEKKRNMLGEDDNKKQYGLDISVIENLKQTKQYVERFVHVYRCKKKISSKTAGYKVYQRKRKFTVFEPMKKKRSVLQTHRRQDLVDFPVVVKSVPDYEEVANSVCALEWLKSREVVPVLKSQRLVKPKQKGTKVYAKDIKSLIKKFAKLDIKSECKAVVVKSSGSRAVVVRKNGSGALVKKKPKKPKLHGWVDLDEESLRVWKIVMENNGSQPFEETDNDKKEWWERQRKVFRGRVDSFIAKMHLIQGDRRFSPWKGSVVDSVVGVYLTQNVSDHLSSSAFMYLAARFAVKSKKKEIDERDEVNASKASVKSNTEIIDEGLSNNDKMDQNKIASYDDAINMSQTTRVSQTEPSNLQDKRCLDENPQSLRNLLDIEEVDVDYLKNFYYNDESELNESKLHKKSTLEEEEARILDPVSSLQSEITMEQVKNDASTKKGKRKKKKEEKEPEVKIDWEKLRENYCQNGKKEINENFMDAVDWDAVMRASVEEIADMIAERGMQNMLADRIKKFLDRMMKDHGSLDLEWLRDVPPDKAKEFLLSIWGIGLKSVECVRLLTLHHNAFPVDTNVGRVATRLGWVPLLPLPEKLEIHLLNSYPMVDTIQKYLYPRLCTLDQKTLYELHYQLITFGKVFCTKIRPNCNACPMRAECRHYASAYASARLPLPAPGPKETTIVSSAPPLLAADVDLNEWDSSNYAQNCEPIVEVPASPEPYVEEFVLPDIEDYFLESDDEIPTIRLNTEEFKETLKETMNKNNNICHPDGDDMSQAIVVMNNGARARPMKVKEKLRTLHIVYELPDFHAILAGFDEREEEDPSPYLLAIWPETTSSKDTHEETVKGTVLIPCRTANRGKFPLNGTYFQVNEVFADDETSNIPMDVPRHLLWSLPRRNLFCGASATSIFKALSIGDIQHIFWRGSICVRGFNRKTRQPRPLHKKFHISIKDVNSPGNKKTGKK